MAGSTVAAAAGYDGADAQLQNAVDWKATIDLAAAAVREFSGAGDDLAWVGSAIPKCISLVNGRDGPEVASVGWGGGVLSVRIRLSTPFEDALDVLVAGGRPMAALLEHLVRTVAAEDHNTILHLGTNCANRREGKIGSYVCTPKRGSDHSVQELPGVDGVYFSALARPPRRQIAATEEFTLVMGASLGRCSLPPSAADILEKIK